MTTELEGVIPINATPFDAAGQVDEASIATLVEFEVRCGVHGLNVLGIMGKAHKLSEGERRRVAEVFLKCAAGRLPVMVGTSLRNEAHLYGSQGLTPVECRRNGHRPSGGRRAAKEHSMVPMLKVSVMYVGQPADPAAFDAYYWGTHLPTVQKWPRIRRITVAKGGPGDELYQIADLWFDSRADLDAALASPERKVSADDVKRFPEFRGQIKRQIFEVTSYWP